MTLPNPSHASRIGLGLAGAFVIALVAFIVTRPEDDASPATRPSGQVSVQMQRTFSSNGPHEQTPHDDGRALKDIPTPELFEQIGAILGVAGADSGDGTYTVTLPRRDLFVIVDGNEVPTSAGVEHVFRFYRCPCGTMLVHGHYLLEEFEVNDVIDALRENVDLKIVDTATFLIASQPRLTLLRFQGEGEPRTLATTLRRPFRWIGPNRTAVDPTDTIPQ